MPLTFFLLCPEAKEYLHVAWFSLADNKLHLEDGPGHAQRLEAFLLNHAGKPLILLSEHTAFDYPQDEEWTNAAKAATYPPAAPDRGGNGHNAPAKV